MESDETSEVDSVVLIVSFRRGSFTHNHFHVLYQYLPYLYSPILTRSPWYTADENIAFQTACVWFFFVFALNSGVLKIFHSVKQQNAVGDALCMRSASLISLCFIMMSCLRSDFVSPVFDIDGSDYIWCMHGMANKWERGVFAYVLGQIDEALIINNNYNNDRLSN